MPRALISLLKLADLAGVLYCDCSLGSGGSYAATGIQTSESSASAINALVRNAKEN
jgi:hypothetical protein